jgi:hypothetical protein
MTRRSCQVSGVRVTSIEPRPPEVTMRSNLSHFVRSAMSATSLLVTLSACELPTAPSADKSIEPTLVAPSLSLTSSFRSAGRFFPPYYGQWCGPSWSGGSTGSESSIDRLDSACKKHDESYAAADRYWQPLFKYARTLSASWSYCQSWKAAYKTADGVLKTAAQSLSSLTMLQASMTRGDAPDVWGYDRRVYGTHVLSATGRSLYRDGVVAASVTGLFKNPPCII